MPFLLRARQYNDPVGSLELEGQSLLSANTSITPSHILSTDVADSGLLETTTIQSSQTLDMAIDTNFSQTTSITPSFINVSNGISQLASNTTLTPYQKLETFSEISFISNGTGTSLVGLFSNGFNSLASETALTPHLRMDTPDVASSLFSQTTSTSSIAKLYLDGQSGLASEGTTTVGVAKLTHDGEAYTWSQAIALGMVQTSLLQGASGMRSYGTANPLGQVFLSGVTTNDSASGVTPSLVINGAGVSSLTSLIALGIPLQGLSVSLTLRPVTTEVIPQQSWRTEIDLVPAVSYTDPQQGFVLTISTFPSIQYAHPAGVFNQQAEVTLETASSYATPSLLNDGQSSQVVSSFAGVTPEFVNATDLVSLLANNVYATPSLASFSEGVSQLQTTATPSPFGILATPQAVINHLSSQWVDPLGLLDLSVVAASHSLTAILPSIGTSYLKAYCRTKPVTSYGVIGSQAIVLTSEITNTVEIAYCGLRQLKRSLNSIKDWDDDLLSFYLKAASRRIDKYTGRIFYPIRATRKYDHFIKHDRYDNWQPIFHSTDSPHESVDIVSGRFSPKADTLFLDDDLLEIEQVLTNGGDTELTTAQLVSIDKYLTSPSEIILVTGDEIFKQGDSPRQSHTVTGLWGYHDNYQTAWVDTGAVLLETIAAPSEWIWIDKVKGIDIDGFMPRLDVFNLIQIDSEWFYITEYDQTHRRFRVKRGVNGTVAVNHDAGAVIHIYRPIDIITMATIQIAIYLYKRKDALHAETVGFAELGTQSYTSGLPKEALEILESLKRSRFRVV